MPPPRSPLGETLSSALGRSESLTGLLQRMRDSQARLAAIADLLPEGLQGTVRAGPLDDAQWVLLVGHAAAAAKLRQLLPALEARLVAAGWVGPALKIKVLPKA